jgi:hypothetical protein
MIAVRFIMHLVETGDASALKCAVECVAVHAQAFIEALREPVDALGRDSVCYFCTALRLILIEPTLLPDSFRR